jgi:hypothetical protein
MTSNTISVTKIVSNNQTIYFRSQLLEKIVKCAERETNGNISKFVANVVEEYITKP